MGKRIFLFIFMGTLYCLIELIWRGYTHISMFFVAGCCGLLIGEINEYLPWNMGIIWQMLIGACIVTIAEFISGVILNIWLNLNVWDYSNMPYNLYGQICLPFALLWIILSGIGIVLDDYLRYWFFNEEKPHYTLL